MGYAGTQWTKASELSWYLRRTNFWVPACRRNRKKVRVFTYTSQTWTPEHCGHRIVPLLPFKSDVNKGNEEAVAVQQAVPCPKVLVHTTFGRGGLSNSQQGEADSGLHRCGACVLGEAEQTVKWEKIGDITKPDPLTLEAGS
ncbi:hypothetical protein Pyn_20854 [Prunus yedoensis var. nudiflora]|uniref:Uncharacterized protein n=1 Tax=Prunus yedoensis var. nudiflora TaxID=2094558 RepID=A0A315ASF8_PRUYE|nr:hypothetical protein Pyn_20854 [Prunus yedoensis var. nudiflora]